ncbi:MAG: undecaprenyldiphospho-muramoylpentapeptide beta-N-acetylglucosaminyltransferase [Culicoidibacterales bacterium]
MRIVLTGGGTGGHIYPALAFAEYVKTVDTDAQFLYIGSSDRMEGDIVPQTGMEFKHLEVKGISRSLSLQNVKAVALFLQGVMKAKRYLKAFKPDFVLGTGGYVSAPVVYAAAKLGIPTAIYEPNSHAGVANRFLGRYVDKAFLCLEDTKKYFADEKIIMTGSPRATEIALLLAKEPNIQRPYKNHVLCFGGSLGAMRLNEAFIAATPALAKKEYDITYVTGKKYFDEVMLATKKNSAPNIHIVPFVDDMPAVMRTADVLMARSGATTLVEAAMFGLPTIFVPSPNVTGDHQLKNAQSFVAANAATLLEEKDLNGQTFIEKIDELMEDSERRAHMRRELQKLAQPEASVLMYEAAQALQKG